MGCAPYVYKDMLELLLLYCSKLHRGKRDQRKILLLMWSIIRICPSARELLCEAIDGAGLLLGGPTGGRALQFRRGAAEMH